MNFSFEIINEKHISSAINLVTDAYSEECKAIQFLPDSQELMGKLHTSISRLFSNGIGVAALSDQKLVGFIAAFELNELWGKCKGAYSPLYGHGAIKENRSMIYQELYKHAAELWIKKNITSHALTLYAHDREVLDTWFWLGFGSRCVDSIRQVTPLSVGKSEVIIKKVSKSELDDLREVQNNFQIHFNNSPMFMPRQKEDPVDYLSEWIKEGDRHLWAAYRDGKAVGLMKIQAVGETFISEHKDMMNITGAYVPESERCSGVATLLLDTVLNWMKANGYTLCGVDFESFNIEGSRFWNKYFIPYTYTLTRRIDERITL